MHARLFLAAQRDDGNVAVFEVPDDGDTLKRAALSVRRQVIWDAQETAILLAPITPHPE